MDQMAVNTPKIPEEKLEAESQKRKWEQTTSRWLGSSKRRGGLVDASLPRSVRMWDSRRIHLLRLDDFAHASPRLPLPTPSGPRGCGHGRCAGVSAGSGWSTGASAGQASARGRAPRHPRHPTRTGTRRQAARAVRVCRPATACPPRRRPRCAWKPGTGPGRRMWAEIHGDLYRGDLYAAHEESHHSPGIDRRHAMRNGTQERTCT